MSAQNKPQPKTNPEKIASKSDFVFGKENYVMMLIGLCVIAIGFALMAGGKSEDPGVFNPEIFNARRIIVAPIVVLAGFVIEVFAIFRKTKD